MKTSLLPSITICFTVLLLTFSFGYGQVTSHKSSQYDSVTLITLTDGSTLIGNIMEQYDSIIILETKNIGRVTLAAGNVKQIQTVAASNFKEDGYWFPNSNATRYLLSPSGFNLRKGEGYYQNTYLLFNAAYVGVSKNVSIGGGFEFFSLFAGHNPMLFLNTKAGFKVAEKVNLAAGILYVRIPQFSSWGENPPADNDVMMYGLGTYGTPDNNITLGVGYGLNLNRGECMKKPVFSISGMTRVGRKVSLISENWLVPGEKQSVPTSPDFETTATYPLHLFVTYGVRFMGEKVSVDLACINSKEIAQAIFIGVPYVDFVVKF
ncbi:MAG: hypothetical protein ABIO46_00075 [Chitinophagales bacterium]